MPKIEFIKVVRDSDYNKRVIREGGPTRELTRDFHVLIDGEHRATLSRMYSGVGYYLGDIDGRGIKDTDPRESWRNSAEVKSQAAFLPFIERMLKDGAIPTRADTEMDRLRDAATRDNKLFDSHLANVDFARKKYANELYRLARLVCGADGPVLEQSLVDLAASAIALIDMQIAAYDKNDEETR